jgi:hypothetical protein
MRYNQHHHYLKRNNFLVTRESKLVVCGDPHIQLDAEQELELPEQCQRAAGKE